MTQSPHPIDSYKGVWVVAELNEAGNIHDGSLEAFTAAQQLSAKTGQPVSAVLFSAPSQDTTQAEATLAYYGAEQIYSLKHDLLGQYQVELYTKALSDLVLDRKPSIVLMATSSTSRDYAPRVAARTVGGMIPDCIDLNVNASGVVEGIHPTYGENMRAKIACANNRPQIITLRAKAFAKGTANTALAVNVETITPAISADLAHCKLIESVKGETKTGKKLEEAEIIVTGGRGMKGPENFQLIEELAQTLGAAVGASRAVVDAGWRPHSEQVGQTGKTVSPQLYFALGISGAIQHQVGMSSSKIIIAINKDADAPIFEIADFGIVGDVFEIIPKLTQTIKEQNLAVSV